MAPATTLRVNGAQYDSQGQATKERRPWTEFINVYVSPEQGSQICVVNGPGATRFALALAIIWRAFGASRLALALIPPFALYSNSPWRCISSYEHLDEKHSRGDAPMSVAWLSYRLSLALNWSSKCI
jgi:hypothetical protein